MDPKYCELCAKHYGDDGICDEGKPVASPHRKNTEDLKRALREYRDRQIVRAAFGLCQPPEES